MKLIGNEVRKEIRLMALENAQSVLCSQSTEELKEFKWDRLHAELSNKAPNLRSTYVYYLLRQKHECLGLTLM